MKRTSVDELLQLPEMPYEVLRQSIASEMHCALPGEVVAFYPECQTADIQPTLRKKQEGRLKDLPLLLDVPVFFPGGAASGLTYPVQKGDECLVIFADANIDAWFQTGGKQNPVTMRQHSLSDGFAFVGFRSRKNALPSIPEDAPSYFGLKMLESICGVEGKDGNVPLTGMDIPVSATDETRLSEKLNDKASLDTVNELIGFRMQVVVTTGILSTDIKDTTMCAKVWHGSKDVTDESPASRFIWRRVSADETGDRVWNYTHQGVKSITLGLGDVYYSATYFCDLIDE